MSKIEIQLDTADLSESIKKIFNSSSNSLTRNPLAAILAECITNAGDSIRQTIDRVTREFIESEEFSNRIKQIYKDAFNSEAARLGRNAARAVVNSKENTQ